MAEAAAAETVAAQHVCGKTYLVKNQVGAMVSITISGIYVKGVVQDPMRFKNSSTTKVSRAISPHHTSHGKMVWVKQASSRCSYWRELRWPSLAWLEGIGSLPSTMELERIAEMSSSSWYDTICPIIWNEIGRFKIQTFWMQGICSSEPGEERERKTYTSYSGSNPPWIRIRLQYECVQVLYSLVWKMHSITSSPIRRGVVPLQESGHE
jgi:hypothetical protein